MTARLNMHVESAKMHVESFECARHGMFVEWIVHVGCWNKDGMHVIKGWNEWNAI